MPAALLKMGGEMTPEMRGALVLDARKMCKDRVVHARFSVLERAAVDAAATAAGLTVSAFIRSLTLEGAGVHPFLTDEDRAILEMLIADIRALGVNVNQIARFVHATGRYSATELSSELTEVQKLLAAVLLELRRYAARGAHRRRDSV